MEDIRQDSKIVDVAIGDIKPYDGSHKVDAAIEMIKESLSEYGFQQPIVVDKNKVIVAGNALYRAALELGMEKVPCIIASHLTDEQIQQYRIADNKTSEFAKWNEKKLRKELSYLESPQSLQFCFDNDILGMLGLNAKPKPAAKPLTEKPEVKEAIKKHVMTDAEKDKQFKEELKQVDSEMMVQPAEYIEYHCSKCGQLVKVKRP